MKGIEKILNDMKPQVKACIKKYSFKIDKIYTYEDLLQEGYATVISSIKQWDGINNKTSLYPFIWMKLNWHFKTLTEKEFQENFQTDFIEEFEKELSETDFKENLENYFNLSKNPEEILLEKLSSPKESKDDINLFDIIYDVLPDNLKKYVTVLKEGTYEPKLIAEKLNCSMQNITYFKNELIKFIQEYQLKP
jgi:DNA-directed RNA polymerase specialized sigma24 family protein